MCAAREIAEGEVWELAKRRRGTTRKYGEPAHHTVIYGGSTLYDLALARDALGRIVQRTELVDGTTRVYEHGYDLAGRLSTVSLGGTVIQTYTYDPNGNRLTEDGVNVVGVYDAQDRIVSYDGTTFTHDANGNRTSQATGSTTKTYTHDAQGTLREATVGATAITYVVDGAARRLKRTVGGSTVTHQWLYRDDLQVAAELDGAGALRWRFVYASGRHVPDAAIDGSGTVHRIVTDQVGTLRLVVRASDGVVVQRMRHDAWGRIEEDYLLAGAQRVPFGFAGGLHDRDTGLVHFGAREYDPVVGRWTTKDPIRWEGGTSNLYEYVNSTPNGAYDPTGKGPLGFFSCLAFGGTLERCAAEELERIKHGPLGDNRDGDGWGGTFSPPRGGPLQPAPQLFCEGGRDSDRCREVAEQCTEECSPLLDGGKKPGNYGAQKFFACKAQCMKREGC